MGASLCRSTSVSDHSPRSTGSQSKLGLDSTAIASTGAEKVEVVKEAYGTSQQDGTDCTVGATGCASIRGAVSLEWLLRFSEQHNVERRGLTTADVVSELVKPQTAADRCCFAELLLRWDPEQQPPAAQERPYYFVSHSWGRRFAETLAMLAQHFEPEQQRLWRRQDGQPLPPLATTDVFLWLDVFAINQHQPLQRALDLSALWQLTQDAQETLMIMDGDGAVLSRIWCLYEAWQSSRAGPGKLRVLSYELDFEPMEKAFADLDVNHARAGVEADRSQIMDDITDVVGDTATATRHLKDALLAGVLAQVPIVEERRTHGSDLKLITAALLCKLYGRLELAEELLQRSLRGCERALGPDHPDTLTAVSNLASLLHSEGKYEEAEPLHRRALESRELVLGMYHPETLAAAHNLAELLSSQRGYDEAEPLFRRALQGRGRVLGPHHLKTRATAASLAAILEAQGRHEEAHALVQWAEEEAGSGGQA